MEIRIKVPAKTNKYYIQQAFGGYSPCIEGYPLYFKGSVLANCVGYVIGRFNCIGGYRKIKYAIKGNAENFIDNCPITLKKGTVPQQGCILVWQKGATKQGYDGAGHVAIVEKVINSYTVFTSESGYGDRIFYNEIRKNANQWGKGSQYKYLGCIYNPAVKSSTTLLDDWMTAAKKDGYYKGNIDNTWGSYCSQAAAKIQLRKGSKARNLVLWLQTALWMYGYYKGTIDGDFGTMTQNAVLDYQKKFGLVQDGMVSTITFKKLLYI